MKGLPTEEAPLGSPLLGGPWPRAGPPARGQRPAGQFQASQMGVLPAGGPLDVSPLTQTLSMAPAGVPSTPHWLHVAIQQPHAFTSTALVWLAVCVYVCVRERERNQINRAVP